MTTFPLNYVVTYCCNCNVPIPMPDDVLAEFRRTGKGFSCINGHSQHFTETEEKRLRRKLEEERSQKSRYLNLWNSEQFRVRALKGQITKLKKKGKKK